VLQTRHCHFDFAVLASDPNLFEVDSKEHKGVGQLFPVVKATNPLMSNFNSKAKKTSLAASLVRFSM